MSQAPQRAVSFSLTSHTDVELVAAVRSGSSLAFAAIYDSYFDSLYRYIYFRVVNQEDAEDLIQKLFLNLLEALRNQRANIVELKSYLYRSAHNLVIDYYRRRKPLHSQTVSLSSTETEEMTGQMDFSEENIISLQEYALLTRAVAALSAIDQQVLTCRFINQLNSQETAQIMGVSESHLRVMQFRALKKLRQMLTENGGHHV